MATALPVQSDPVAPLRHPYFYFEDGTIHILVCTSSSHLPFANLLTFSSTIQCENTLYCVYRGVLGQRSEFWRIMLDLPKPPGKEKGSGENEVREKVQALTEDAYPLVRDEGSAEEPLLMYGVDTKDLEHIMTYLYARYVDLIAHGSRPILPALTYHSFIHFDSQLFITTYAQPSTGSQSHASISPIYP